MCIGGKQHPFTPRNNKKGANLFLVFPFIFSYQIFKMHTFRGGIKPTIDSCVISKFPINSIEQSNHIILKAKNMS